MNCSFIITHSVSAAGRCSSQEEKAGPTMMSAQPLCSCSTMRLTSAIHLASAAAGLFFALWISPKNDTCACVRARENVKMCVHWEVCEWQRGSSLAPAFLSAAVGRAISADSGWDVVGGSGIKGLLARTESGSFSLWQREVTGRQRTGDRRTASQRHLHSFRTAAYPCTEK